MKRATVGMIATAVLAVATMAFAQAKPDFSGTWAPDAAAAPAGTGGGGAPGGGGGGGGRGMAGPMTVKQSGDTLTIERTMGENKVTQTYKLDGSESKNAGRGGDQVSKAVWDGAKLKITTTTANGDVVRVLSLEGGNLVIDSTTPGREGGAPMTTKAVYKKG